MEVYVRKPHLPASATPWTSDNVKPFCSLLATPATYENVAGAHQIWQLHQQLYTKHHVALKGKTGVGPKCCKPADLLQMSDLI